MNRLKIAHARGSSGCRHIRIPWSFAISGCTEFGSAETEEIANWGRWQFGIRICILQLSICNVVGRHMATDHRAKLVSDLAGGKPENHMAVVLIATLDTKGGEAEFVRDLLHAKGLETLVIDAGVLGDPA